MRWRNTDLAPVSLVELATLGERGRPWYIDSGYELACYALQHGHTLQYVADVLAILSPRVQLAHNIRLAKAYLETGKAPGAMRSRLNALAKYEVSGLFNGPKVNAFSQALQGDADAVVIDAWMYRAVGVQKPKRGDYERVAGLVQATAAELGWAPAAAQAAIWTGARAYVGHTAGYEPIRMAA